MMSGARSRAGRVRKTSRRDLPYVLAKRLTGATTVSATMLLAARAGIHIFVTGGAACPFPLHFAIARKKNQAHTIVQHVYEQLPAASSAARLGRLLRLLLFPTGIGGVHRGGESTLDVSADLTELGRTPVAVVCAGVKSILDIPRTLEYLETQVTPVSYCCICKALPAFPLRRGPQIDQQKCGVIEGHAAHR